MEEIITQIPKTPLGLISLVLAAFLAVVTFLNAKRSISTESLKENVKILNDLSIAQEGKIKGQTQQMSELQGSLSDLQKEVQDLQAKMKDKDLILIAALKEYMISHPEVVQKISDIAHGPMV